MDVRLNDAGAGEIPVLTNKIGDVGVPNSLRHDLSVARHDLSIRTAEVNTRQNTVKGYQNALAQKNANFAVIQPLLTAAEADLQAAEDQKITAENNEFLYSRQLRQAEELLGWLEAIDETRKRISAISTRMNAALIAVPPQDTKAIAGEFVQLAKHMDILLNPIAKDDGKTINLGSIAEDKRKQIEDILNAGA